MFKNCYILLYSSVASLYSLHLFIMSSPKPSFVELSLLKMADLKSECKKLGLYVTGSKPILISRLLDFHSGGIGGAKIRVPKVPKFQPDPVLLEKLTKEVSFIFIFLNLWEGAKNTTRGCVCKIYWRGCDITIKAHPPTTLL